MKPLKIHYVQSNGDCALLVFFKPHPQQALRLQSLAHYVRQQPFEDMVDVVPAANSLMLVLDRPVTINDDIVAVIEDACVQSSALTYKPQVHEIPVCYHPKVAPDLKAVMAHTGLGLDDIVAIHSQPRYRVSFLGFLPGFAYLSGLPEALQIQRKSAPSRHTPAGSVAIANQQTGLYALNSPAGWHVIGQTPMVLFDWQSPQVLPYQPLDEIKFKPIDLNQFKQDHHGN